MHSRWFNAAVVMLWLATMSWLVTEKVLPQLLVGEPPSSRQIVKAQSRMPPVGWSISLDGRRLGWALTDTKPQPNGLTEIHGRVHFHALPLEKIIPSWFQSFSQFVGNPIGKPQLDVWSLLVIDSLGHLLRFDSRARLDPWNEVISVRGTVEGRQLRLLVRTSGASLTHETFLPSNALLSDVLSPQTQLPGLHAGQTWTVPVYSPFWPAKNPVEIIRATVEGTEPIFWNGDMENAWLVVYRGDSGGGADGDRNLKGRLWVRCDGAVLRQQVLLFDSVVTFVRLTDEEAVELAKAAGRQWWRMESRSRMKNHD